MRTTVYVQHLPSNFAGLGQVNNGVDNVASAGDCAGSPRELSRCIHDSLDTRGYHYLLLIFARFLNPRPESMEAVAPDVHTAGLPRVFWIYLVGAGLVAAGFADFQLIAFHFEKADAVKDTWIPITYSIAMAVSGIGSLMFGRLFDRVGIGVLVPLTLVSAAFAPLVFLGGFWQVIAG